MINLDSLVLNNSKYFTRKPVYTTVFKIRLKKIEQPFVILKLRLRIWFWVQVKICNLNEWHGMTLLNKQSFKQLVAKKCRYLGINKSVKDRRPKKDLDLQIYFKVFQYNFRRVVYTYGRSHGFTFCGSFDVYFTCWTSTYVCRLLSLLYSVVFIVFSIRKNLFLPQKKLNSYENIFFWPKESRGIKNEKKNVQQKLENKKTTKFYKT